MAATLFALLLYPIIGSYCFKEQIMNQPELGIKVTELRVLKGLTQESLAELCEVSTRTIQRVESGEVDPRSYTLLNLGNHLNYDFLEDEKSEVLPWLVALHLSSILCIVVIPLLIWSFKKRLGNPIDRHGKEVINFQITITILLFSALLFLMLFIPGTIVLMERTGWGPDDFLVLLPILGLIPFFILGILCLIQGASNTLRVLTDKPPRYRLSITFLK